MKRWVMLVAGLLALAPISLAGSLGNTNAEQDRLQNAGTVMQEILQHLLPCIDTFSTMNAAGHHHTVAACAPPFWGLTEKGAGFIYFR